MLNNCLTEPWVQIIYIYSKNDYFMTLSLHGAAPEYLRDCCIGTHSSASGLQLRSLERTDRRVRRTRTHFGDRAFIAVGPRSWNSLPPIIRLADSVDSFKAQLKTYLFTKAYPVKCLWGALVVVWLCYGTIQIVVIIIITRSNHDTKHNDDDVEYCTKETNKMT